MLKVFTTEGKVAFTGNFKGEPFDAQTAEAQCKKVNAEAEALGIKTRYEVKEVLDEGGE